MWKNLLIALIVIQTTNAGLNNRLDCHLESKLFLAKMNKV